MTTWQWITAHPAETAWAVVGFTTSLAILIRGAIPVLANLALLTATRADDDFIAKLGPVLDKLIAALDIIRRGPRLVIGPFPSTQPIARVAEPRPSMRPVSGAPPAPEPVTTTLRQWPEVITPPGEEPKL